MWPRRDVPRWRCLSKQILQPHGGTPPILSHKIPWHVPTGSSGSCPPLHLLSHGLSQMPSPLPDLCTHLASLLSPALGLTSPEELAHPDWFQGSRSRTGWGCILTRRAQTLHHTVDSTSEKDVRQGQERMWDCRRDLSLGSGSDFKASWVTLGNYLHLSSSSSPITRKQGSLSSAPFCSRGSNESMCKLKSAVSIDSYESWKMLGEEAWGCSAWLCEAPMRGRWAWECPLCQDHSLPIL